MYCEPFVRCLIRSLLIRRKAKLAFLGSRSTKGMTRCVWGSSQLLNEIGCRPFLKVFHIPPIVDFLNHKSEYFWGFTASYICKYVAHCAGAAHNRKSKDVALE